MVRASHRSSEGCGSDFRLGLRNRFLSIGLDDHSPILRYIQALTFLKHKTALIFVTRLILMSSLNPNVFTLNSNFMHDCLSSLTTKTDIQKINKLKVDTLVSDQERARNEWILVKKTGRRTRITERSGLKSRAARVIAK